MCKPYHIEIKQCELFPSVTKHPLCFILLYLLCSYLPYYINNSHISAFQRLFDFQKCARVFNFSIICTWRLESLQLNFNKQQTLQTIFADTRKKINFKYKHIYLAVQSLDFLPILFEYSFIHCVSSGQLDY